MAKKVIVVRIGTNEVQIVHMEHTANYPTVYGCVRFPTPENAVKDGMIIEVAEAGQPAFGKHVQIKGFARRMLFLP